MKPVFQDEVQLAGWSESHTSGAKVTFWLHDPELLATFRGMTERKGKTAGQRLAMVLVEIGDDETPIAPPEPKEKTGPLCLLAVRWCQDDDFYRWYEMPPHSKLHGVFRSELDAKEFICETCGIQSRKELDHNPEAADKFHRLIRIPYMKYLEGK